MKLAVGRGMRSLPAQAKARDAIDEPKLIAWPWTRTSMYFIAGNAENFDRGQGR